MAKDDKPIEEVKEIPEPEEKESPEPEAPKEAEVVEEKTPEEPEPELEAPEEEKPPSRREQLRVQQLLERYGPPPEKPPATQGPDFSQQIDADDDTLKALEDTAKQFGDNQYHQGLERAKYYKWETLLSVDEPQVRSKYPELDPANKEKFHPALASAMANKFAAFAGYDAGNPEAGIPRSVRNSDIRYLDFVEAEMEFADEIASQRVAQTTENIAKQSAQTGLRPDGSSAKRLNLNQAPEGMSIEELYASIGQTPPKN